ncbi:amine oxidase [Thamnocephalis sphaerospora]|uniref:Amine oxidase n=1 Tax=Thamnocephalis sphaerospora TaxID=78915 RepID=A0A4P9XIY0_9FUNG|nr:amine oxidase [Thamnocephalis sphaerospora]|eukprot:RKP05685.1 amine oxidase [Thamnocephalis sphaerospora]
MELADSRLSIADVYDGLIQKEASQCGVDLALLRGMLCDFAELGAVDSSQLSLQNLVVERGDDGAHAMAVGGFPELMRRAVGDDVIASVRLGQVVTQVAYDGAEIRVSTAGGTEYSADAVIVTVPLGVLKANAIKFCPPLPARKQLAIERLGFGHMNVVVLEFDRLDASFASMHGHLFLLCPNGAHDDTDTVAESIREEGLHLANHMAVTGRPVLTAYTMGVLAKRLESYSDDKVADLFFRLLHRFFPHADIPRPRRAALGRWISDPYARGSYSFMSMDSYPEDFDALAAPCYVVDPGSDSKIQSNTGDSCPSPMVFWAGEHTRRADFSTVGAAYLSGVRAALETAIYFDARAQATAASKIS